MGGINFGPEILADNLSETAGYKAGLALSVEELCDHLSGTEYPDIIRNSEQNGVRLRSEEYEDLFYKLLHRIGYTKEEYQGVASIFKLIHNCRKNGTLDVYEGVMNIHREMMDTMTKDAVAKNSGCVF